MPEHTVERLARVLLSPEQALLSEACNLRELELFLPHTGEQFIPASVLCALVARDAGLHVLLTKRAGYLRHHAGQISFPGGRAERHDADAAATALREAEEEVGLPRGAIDIIGQLPHYNQDDDASPPAASKRRMQTLIRRRCVKPMKKSTWHLNPRASLVISTRC